MKNTLLIGPNWFSHEKRAYANYKTAIIRELLQNSTARNLNASRIDLDTIQIETGTRIVCADNGKGMARDILENVFLILGETSKGQGEIGGLGIARNLICFSSDKYTIKSDNYLVEGCGASYEIKNHPKTNGCIFEIDVENSNWEDHIKYVLDRSHLNQGIYINGKQYQNNLRRGKMVREMSFGQVWVNKSGNPQLIVRAGGMYMFDHEINCKAQVILEIDPDKAKEILTSNRDSLKWEQRKEIDNFLAELSADSRSSLKDKTKHFKKFVNKDKCFRSKPRAIKLIDSGGQIKQNIFLGCEVTERESVESEILSHGANPMDAEILPCYLTDALLTSMLILNQSEDAKTVNLINNFYHPQHWKTRESTRYQLLRVWAAINSVVMDELSNHTKQEYNWSNGWVFSDSDGGESTEACHLHENDIHYLLLNPIDFDRKLKYSVISIDDYFSLIVLSVHEASHVLYNFHTEDFSSLFTTLLQKVLTRRKEIVNNCKEAKNN